MDLKEQIQKMLDDFKAELKKDLEVKGDDGQVFKLTDLFKMYPKIAAKHEELVKRFEDMEAKVRERKFAADLPGVEDEAKKFSLLRVFRAIATKNWDKAGFEKEVLDNTRRRALSTELDSGSGYLVPAQAMPGFIELLRAESVCMGLGATVLPNLTGAPVYWPKQTGGATVYWIGENTVITPGDLTFGMLELRPRKAAALMPVANEVIAMADPSIEAVIRADLATQVGLSADLKYLRGSGASGEPLGIANTANINTSTLGTGNGAVPDAADPWADMEYQLAVDNALRGRLGFAFHPALKKIMRRIRVPQYSGDTGGDYPRFFPLDDRGIEAVINYPFRNTTQIPINLETGESSNCTEIYFANWAELLIGLWGGMEIAVSTEAGNSFAYDQTWFRIITRTDCGLRHNESFCLCNSARIASS